MRQNHIAILGASISGNKGAEAMLRATVHHIAKRIPNSRFSLLSVYPREDRALNPDQRIAILPFTPIWLLFIIPLCCLYYIFGLLRIPRRFFRVVSPIRALLDADMVIDVAGISFSDGRGIVTLYNVAMILPCLLLKRKLIKVSQALGPFKSFTNRILARVCLSRVERIVARGEISRRNMFDIGVVGVPVCADVAFAMPVSKSAEKSAEGYCRDMRFDSNLAAVSPSAVVESYCNKNSIDYTGIMAQFVDYVIKTYDVNVIMFAHAARPGHATSRTNDLPTCRRIHALIRHQERCCLIDANCNAEELRYIIGKTKYFLASRFHAMISGLTMRVPTLLVGWSHKYLEVLDMFELGAWQMDYTSLTLDTLVENFDRMVTNANELREKIHQHLPGVIKSSESNWDYAMQLLNHSSSPEEV